MSLSIPLTGSPPPALPHPIIYHQAGHGWLCQPGATAATILSLHTRQGVRVRMAKSQFMDLSGLPADEYLLRVQLPDGLVYVSPVRLD